VHFGDGEAQRLQAAGLHDSVVAKTFRCAYDVNDFGDFPQDSVFVESIIDTKGVLAPFPSDPRCVMPTPNRHVVVTSCAAGHPLVGQLRCIARQVLQPGFTLPYAGELYDKKKDHDRYSSSYACNAAGGMVVDGLRYCNEAAFVNHYDGIAAEPNCQLDESETTMAAVSVIRPIDVGEELLVDYGIEYCLRNQVPNPRAPDFGRDLIALSLLTHISNQLTALKTTASNVEQQVSAGSASASQTKSELGLILSELATVRESGIGAVKDDALSETGREQVKDMKSDLMKQVEGLAGAVDEILRQL